MDEYVLRSAIVSSLSAINKKLPKLSSAMAWTNERNLLILVMIGHGVKGIGKFFIIHGR